jgi:sortase A
MTTLFATRPPAAAPHEIARGSRGRPPRLPRVPKRAPRPLRSKPVLTQRELMAQSILLVISAMLLALVLNVTTLSQVQHLVAQQQLINDYREQLAAGTAPVSEGDFDNHLLADGAALGVLSIPSLGVNEVIVEGTSSTVLKNGPGHRRDTVLPGQAGVSVVMGRAAAFGGPFGRIQELAPGDTFRVRTGQGDNVFSVIGVRYAGDPLPSPPTAKQSRLVLETARGPSFIPSGVAYVDTQLVGVAKPAGVRQTTYSALPPGSLAMATDTATIWALVFALQFLLLVEFGAVWAYRHIGAQKTWIVFAPLTVLAGLYVANQVTILLPNLL